MHTEGPLCLASRKALAGCQAGLPRDRLRARESAAIRADKSARLDFIVIAAADEQRLALVELHAAHRPIVLIEAVDERAHSVVPQLRTIATDASAVSILHDISSTPWQRDGGSLKRDGGGGRGGVAPG